MELIFWQNTWYVLILAAFTIFTVLDGSDLGAGILMVFFRRDAVSRQALLKPVTPFWDGNEVWLIIALAAMFAAFPPSFTTLLSSGFLPLLIIMLFLGMRSVAFGFRYHGGENPVFWEILISISSIIIAIGFFIGFGTMLNGFELNPKYEILDDIEIFFSPVALCTALAGFTLLAFHSTVYQLHRGDAVLRERMLALIKPLSVISIAVLTLFTAVLIYHKPELFNRPLFFAGAAVSILAPLASLIISGWIGGLTLYLISSASVAGLWLMIGSSLYPAIVPSAVSDAMSMTIFNTSTSVNGLSTLAAILIPFYIIIAVYTVFVHTRFTKINTEKQQTMSSELIICKACGYIMRKNDLHDVCPACGVPAKIFEPYTEKLSPKRKFILMLDIHPVMAHFPQAFTFTLFGLFTVSIFASEKLLPVITSTIDVIAVLLPISIIITLFAGLFDGKVRFRKVTTPILKKKIIVGILFIFITAAIAVLHLAAPASGLYFGIKFALSAVSLGFAAYLGIVGASLINAKFPG